MRGNFAHKVAMAKEAVRIQHSGISGFDTDWIVKSPQGECNGMVIAVAGFDQPFAEKIMRYMAIIACGDSVMAGFLPAVELVPHDMAVHTCLWIVGEVRSAFGEIECVSARAQEYSN